MRVLGVYGEVVRRTGGSFVKRLHRPPSSPSATLPPQVGEEGAVRHAAPRLMRLAIVAGLFLVAACARGGGPENDPAGGFWLAAQPPLTELAWIAPGADKLRVLTEAPGECLRAPADEDAHLVEVGRAAFESPLLFGGQAARGGLSCASCHRNGRDNDAFFLAGLSGAPGTADVTSSLFSKSREDAVFNPVPIPSLVGAAGKDAFGTRAPAPSLHAFIESAVTGEFQGAPPPNAVLRGLAAYVAHLDPAACPEGAAPRTVRSDMADIARALAAAGEAARRDDAATADFLLLSAQSALGRVHERYAGPALGAQRNALKSLSTELAAIRPVLAEDAAAARGQIARAIEAADALGEDLHVRRRESLYDIETLAAALGE